MNEFRARVALEAQELLDKIEKLSTFIKSDNFDKVDDRQKPLLKIQLLTMKSYLKCLNERINVFDDVDREIHTLDGENGPGNPPRPPKP